MYINFLVKFFKDIRYKFIKTYVGIIYKLTSPSSKIYIGQTIRTFEKRLQGHQNKNSCCRKLKEAIDENGFENFPKKEIWEGPNNELGENGKTLYKRI